MNNQYENTYQNTLCDVVDTSKMSVPTEPLTKSEFDLLKEELNFANIKTRVNSGGKSLVTIENEKLKLFTSLDHFIQYYKGKGGLA